MLKIQKLEKSFGGVKAVQDCDFVVEENNIVALIGPNGAGKTTVFNIITGLVTADKGKVYFKKKPILGLHTHQIANLGIARTFQLNRVFPKLNVLENLLLARQKKGDSFWLTIFKQGIIKKEEECNKKNCLEILETVGLKEKKDFLAENLSYGQRKLLEIARTLATDAELLLLDEPVAGVSPVMREKIKKVLLKLKEQGKTILFIEHDMNFVMGIADKVVVMDHGEEIAVGAPKQIQKNKRVIEAYLGEKVNL